MHTVIKLGKDRIIARIIPGVSVPLLMGMNYKESHADHAEVATDFNTDVLVRRELIIIILIYSLWNAYTPDTSRPGT